MWRILAAVVHRPVTGIFFCNFCVTFQGCSKVLWGAVGAAVVITLITVTAVYLNSK